MTSMPCKIKYLNCLVDSDVSDHYDVLLTLNNDITKRKYPSFDFVSNSFYSKKDAMKFIEKNANSYDTFYLDFVSHNPKKKDYSQHGTIIDSFDPGNRSGKDICLSAKKEEF